MTNEEIAQHITDTADKLMGRESPNGDLPPIRESLVAQAERVHQEIMHERDGLRARLLEADTTISGLKAQLAVSELEASQLRNRADNSIAIVNDAIARRAELEAVLRTIQATLRAFQIDNVPLVRETTSEEAYAENLARDYAPDDLHRPDPVRDGGRK